MAAPLIDVGNADTPTVIVGDNGDYLGSNKRGTLVSSEIDKSTEQGGKKTAERGNNDGRADDHSVCRSAVMLEFGPEAPSHAERASGSVQQLPFPDGWDDPEVKLQGRHTGLTSCSLER